MQEATEAASLINQHADPEANILFGVGSDSKIDDGVIRITVIATGFEGVKRHIEIEEEAEVYIEEQEEPIAPPKTHAHTQSKFNQKPMPAKRGEKSEQPKPAQPKQDDLNIPTFLRRKQ